jgi:uncharacterized protein
MSLSIPPPPRPRSRVPGFTAIEREDRLVLDSRVEWLIDGGPDELDTLAMALGSLGERLSPELLVLRFGNAIGLFELPLLGRVEAVTATWGHQHFEWMLADLMRVASALPFTAGTAAALPYDRAVAASDDVLYHAFVYLRHILSDQSPPDDRLVPALRVILTEPVRRLQRTRELVPIEQAHTVDSASLAHLVTGQASLVRAPSADAPRLSDALRGHVPARIDQRRVDMRHDTPENRFVKTFLEAALGLIDRMRVVVQARAPRDIFARRLDEECAEMERMLRPIIGHHFWRGIGPMIHLPAGSTVLHRRRGYRDIFRHFARLRLAARVPMTRSLVTDLLEVKDIARLYELWCYFALADCLTRLLGPPTVAGRPRTGPIEMAIPWEMEITWPAVRLLYNPRFSRSRPPGRRTSSVPLRPDIALVLTAGPVAGLHLFDAKFRLQSIALVMAEGEGSDEEDERAAERRGSFKRADLYKMHAYRDAISTTRSVWILYPGDEFRFFRTDGQLITSFTTAGEAVNGVGAVPATPANGPQPGLEAVLTALVAGLRSE